MYIYYSMEQITLISLCVPNLDTITIILNKFENYANITYQLLVYPYYCVDGKISEKTTSIIWVEQIKEIQSLLCIKEEKSETEKKIKFQK